jgi:hypothetical protein
MFTLQQQSARQPLLPGLRLPSQPCLSPHSQPHHRPTINQQLPHHTQIQTKPRKLYRRQHILLAPTLELPCMLVPLVPIYRYSHDRMPSDSRESSLTAAVAAPGSRSESPKRKYTEAMTLPSRLPTLNVDVPDIAATDAYYLSEGKCDSPRSRVAEKLEALDIDQAASASAAEEDAPRKRIKTDQQQPASKLSGFDVTPKKLPRPRFDLPHQQHRSAEAVLEIAETPGCRPDVDARPSTPSPLAKQVETPMSKQSISPIVRITPKRMRSPPPPMASPSSPDKSANGLSTSPENSKNSTESSDTAWQDSEITGHHIHAALGDDGEGINGIGFRPTPAIAQARSQKRKHQLSEWRAREAKEARQRRYEKRQGCAVDAGGGDESQRRVVRFEEIG